jgi:hypothetical protein
MSYKYSREDYLERKQRCNDGQGSDEDRRLVKMYERAADSPPPSGGSAQETAIYDALRAEEEVDEAEEVPYADMSAEDLKAELDRRKVLELEAGMAPDEAGKLFSKSGSKKDLIARLEADDKRYDEAGD